MSGAWAVGAAYRWWAGHGVVALSRGVGTGKTLAAEVVRGAGHRPLHRRVVGRVDKYIGETEKNLEKIFAEADRTNAVLFDEADAIFGKRSESRTPTTATPIWRVPTYCRGWSPSTASLCSPPISGPTSTRPSPAGSSADRSRSRPVAAPGSLAPQPDRSALRGRHRSRLLPRDFELAGGSIRSAVVTAAYIAVGRGTPVTTEDLLAERSVSTARRDAWSPARSLCRSSGHGDVRAVSVAEGAALLRRFARNQSSATVLQAIRPAVVSREAARIEVERTQVRLEVDVEPLALRGTGFASRGRDQCGAEPLACKRWATTVSRRKA